MPHSSSKDIDEKSNSVSIYNPEPTYFQPLKLKETIFNSHSELGIDQDNSSNTG